MNFAGLRSSRSHPAADKGIEHVVVGGDSRFDLFPDLFFRICGIERDLGHGGLLAHLLAEPDGWRRIRQ
jgi:hypothetical protein